MHKLAVEHDNLRQDSAEVLDGDQRGSGDRELGSYRVSESSVGDNAGPYPFGRRHIVGGGPGHERAGSQHPDRSQPRRPLERPRRVELRCEPYGGGQQLGPGAEARPQGVCHLVRHCGRHQGEGGGHLVEPVGRHGRHQSVQRLPGHGKRLQGGGDVVDVRVLLHQEHQHVGRLGRLAGFQKSAGPLGVHHEERVLEAVLIGGVADTVEEGGRGLRLAQTPAGHTFEVVGQVLFLARLTEALGSGHGFLETRQRQQVHGAMEQCRS